nr:TonB-dependent receptor [Caulobacter hibisci]
MAKLEGRRALNGSATLSWTPDAAQRIDLAYSAGKDFRYRDTITTAAPILYYRFSDDIEREQLALSYKGDWSWGYTSLRAYRSEIERVNIRSAKQTPSAPVRIVEQVVDGVVSIPVAGAHRFSVGGDLRRQNLCNPEVNDWQTSPRHYTVFHATERLTLKGGVGRGFKAPSLTQLSPDYDVAAAGGRSTVFGNPNLKPEIRHDLKNLVETQCTAFCGIRGR